MVLYVGSGYDVLEGGSYYRNIGRIGFSDCWTWGGRSHWDWRVGGGVTHFVVESVGEHLAVLNNMPGMDLSDVKIMKCDFLKDFSQEEELRIFTEGH